MTGYMTPDARAVAISAYEHAIRLGHGYLGGEHFLLALAAADQAAAAVLRGFGVTAGHVEVEIIRRAAEDLFGDLDQEALTAIGIDVGAVRTIMTATFEPGALSQAG